MKLSDFIADFLARKGISHAFVITGGASVHIIDSIARNPQIDFVCCLHEQACAMAADGYARASGNIGVAITTSGPGATNLITGICSAYYDSIPVLFITGQVATFRMKGATGVRQIGFQETDIIDICRPITKYVVQLIDPQLIRYELEKCCHIAQSGRPGPVLIDIPDNFQRVEIDPEKLKCFNQPVIAAGPTNYLEETIDSCISLINNAQRPVVIFGQGIHSAGAHKEAGEFIRATMMPFALTWAAADLFPSDRENNIGTFGTHGTRFGNFAVQNADLIISIGTRLDTKATGSPADTFARKANKVMVDIDENEIKKFNKFGLHIDVPVCCDAKTFLATAIDRLKGQPKKGYPEWTRRIQQLKNDFPVCLKEYYKQNKINPYVFVKVLSGFCEAGETIVIDTGCTVAWMMQAFEFKNGQRMLHDWNNTAMGWSLPAAIGSCLAMKKKRIICVMGDGSLHMNLQELATVIKNKLPIKIFLMNNMGYSMIKQTQEQWLDRRYFASTSQGGLPTPDFSAIARAYGHETLSISKNAEIHGAIEKSFHAKGSFFCNIEMDPNHRVVPLVKFGRPNEDPEPLLERKLFLNNMIIAPLDVCRE
jgi:acetolactate synthase I/II/III large subunit